MAQLRDAFSKSSLFSVNRRLCCHLKLFNFKTFAALLSAPLSQKHEISQKSKVAFGKMVVRWVSRYRVRSLTTYEKTILQGRRLRLHKEERRKSRRISVSHYADGRIPMRNGRSETRYDALQSATMGHFITKKGVARTSGKRLQQSSLRHFLRFYLITKRYPMQAHSWGFALPSLT